MEKQVLIANKPLISVIIPTYNRGEALARMLGYLNAQSYLDFEVLVVVDGSTDHTLEVLAVQQTDMPNLNYFYQENQGILRAREAGFNLSRGRYLLFVDDDDWIHPAALEKLAKVIREVEPDLIYFGFHETRDGVKTEFKPRVIKEFFNLSSFAYWSKCIRKGHFEECVNFAELPSISYLEDNITLLLGLDSPEISVIEDILYHRLLTEDSHSACLRDKYCDDFKILYEYFIHFFSRSQLLGEYQNALTLYFYMHKQHVERRGSSAMISRFEEFETLFLPLIPKEEH